MHSIKSCVLFYDEYPYIYLLADDMAEYISGFAFFKFISMIPWDPCWDRIDRYLQLLGKPEIIICPRLYS